MKKFKWSYNEEDDVLYIFDPRKKAKESVEIYEDVVIDIDKDKNLIGIEIFYANDLFKAIDKNFPKNVMTDLKEVQVEFSTYRNFVIIKLLIEYNNKTIVESLPPISINKYESPIVGYV